MIKHPTNRAERLRINRKHSLKHSRRKGLTDGTNDAGRIDETPSEENISIQADDAQQDALEQRSLGLSGETAHL